MLIAVSIGNLTTELGAFEGDILLFKARLCTDRNKTSDEYSVLIGDILKIRGYNTGDICALVLSSVVPNVTESIRGAIEIISPNVRTVVVGPGVKTGLNIKIDNPLELGADMVATSVGAIAGYFAPIVTVDFSTATKMCLLDRNNCLLGGTIMPGVRSSLDALAEKTAQLPSISLEGEVNPISTSTEASMRSGFILGTAAMVDGMIANLEERVGKIKTVVACGDIAEIIIPYCKREITIDQNLILNGLRVIYEKTIATKK